MGVESSCAFEDVEVGLKLLKSPVDPGSRWGSSDEAVEDVELKSPVDPGSRWGSFDEAVEDVGSEVELKSPVCPGSRWG